MNRSAFVMALVCAGCEAPPNIVETTHAIGGDGGCPVWGCGSNSPVIDAIELFDLNELGEYNTPGFRVVKFEKYWANAWRQYRPDVRNGELVARNLATGAIVHEGAAIAGARFELYNENRNTFYYLIVAKTEPVGLWAKGPNGYATGNAYYLMWTYKDFPKEAHQVCGESDDGDGLAPFEAVLFDGDRIDADNLRVVGQNKDWFNIGCKGHALAKQHLTGNTWAAGQLLGITTTLDQRTANLKMITADYCGKGHPMTQPHVPLHWKDESGWWSDVEMTDTIEARWTADGAACLETPRVDAHPPDPYLLPEDVETMIGKTCVRPPPCSDLTMAMDGAHVLSANPP
jgi:ADYC domain-containing protein